MRGRLRSRLSERAAKDGSTDWDKEEAQAGARNRIKRDTQLVNQQRRYATGFFSAHVLWLVFVAITVAAVGLGCFHLSDSIVLALIATTTLNATAPVYILARYVFSRR